MVVQSSVLLFRVALFNVSKGWTTLVPLFEEVFVPDGSELLPPGVYFQAASRWPHMFMTLTPAYMGLAQAAYDFTVTGATSGHWNIWVTTRDTFMPMRTQATTSSSARRGSSKSAVRGDLF